MHDSVFDLTRTASSAGILEYSVTLSKPQSRLKLRLPPGEAGRAEALFEGRSWAAKHCWREDDSVLACEFDEPLPPGRIVLRVPLRQP